MTDKAKLASTFPDGPADAMKKQAGKTDDGGGSTPIRYVASKGTQHSMNPKKDQPRTMRYLRG
jgi:hypothetical protein